MTDLCTTHHHVVSSFGSSGGSLKSLNLDVNVITPPAEIVSHLAEEGRTSLENVSESVSRPMSTHKGYPIPPPLSAPWCLSPSSAQVTLKKTPLPLPWSAPTRRSLRTHRPCAVPQVSPRRFCRGKRVSTNMMKNGRACTYRNYMKLP